MNGATAAILRQATVGGYADRTSGCLARAFHRIDMKTPKTFAAALTELESVVERLEAGEVGLEEALALYEQGLALSKACLARLDAAELRIRKLEADGGAAAPEP